MRSSRFLFWRLPLVIASLATLLFLAGFWVALRGTLGAPLGVPPPPASPAHSILKPSGKQLLLVLGDSLARGTGDESGRGFASDVQDAMTKRGPTEVANLSVNGAESSELRDLCASANVQSLAASADLILVSIGGNDLSHAVPRFGEPTVRTLEDITTARSRYAENLRAIVQSLRRANASAPLFLLELYDPFGGGGPGSASGVRTGASVLMRWNDLISETALGFPNTIGIPTFDLFEARPDRLANDRFHPNRTGYALIAARMIQDLRDTP